MYLHDIDECYKLNLKIQNGRWLPTWKLLYWHILVIFDEILYDTIEEFNVGSKAEYSA